MTPTGSVLDDLIERNDPDPLLRLIDENAGRNEWQTVIAIRDRCNAATERGKTLWGVAEHANYRVALGAPGNLAATTVDGTTGPLALGPPAEVIASTHTWSEVKDHLVESPFRGMVAYECVALGEDLRNELDLQHHRDAFEMPLHLFAWEPQYIHAEYLEDEVRTASPVLKTGSASPIHHHTPTRLDDPDTIGALRSLVQAWLSQSNGVAGIEAVRGNVDTAILMVDETASTKLPVHTTSALQWMAWVAASGGAHGRRRGIAAGRHLTWLAVAHICGLMESGEMPEGDEIASALTAVQWFTWGSTDLSSGWHLRLAVHDTYDDVCFAINAHDTTG